MPHTEENPRASERRGEERARFSGSMDGNVGERQSTALM